MSVKSNSYPWMTGTLAGCHDLLRSRTLKISPGVIDGIPYCNGTYDGMLCWPPTRANSSTSHQCPPLKGLNHENIVTKFCNTDGRWPGNPNQHINNAKEWGWTNYFVCLPVDPEIAMRAKSIAQNVRYVEFVCLSLSFLSLLLSLIIFTVFRRLLVFRNMVHVQLMISILLVTTIRFIIYVDVDITQKMVTVPSGFVGPTINSSKYLCEAFYALLEYSKSVAYAWMVLEGFYLHNTLVCHVFSGEPQLWKYCATAWAFPAAHIILWVLAIVWIHGPSGIQRCFGSYYWDPEFWILEAIRLLEIIVNSGFLVNIIRVLWNKMRDSSHGNADAEQMRKSVKALLMLTPLLGIPNVLQQIPIKPTRNNIHWWAFYLYVCETTYTIQGFFIALIYCFTNKEVVSCIKNAWFRHQLQHDSFNRTPSRRSRIQSSDSYGFTSSIRRKFHQRAGTNYSVQDIAESTAQPIAPFSRRRLHGAISPAQFSDKTLTTIDSEAIQLTIHNVDPSRINISKRQQQCLVPYDGSLSRMPDENGNPSPEAVPLMLTL